MDASNDSMLLKVPIGDQEEDLQVSCEWTTIQSNMANRNQFTGSFVQISVKRLRRGSRLDAVLIRRQTSSAYHMLRACSQIYAEGHPVYLEHTRFIISGAYIADHLIYLAAMYDVAWPEWQPREGTEQQIAHYFSNRPGIKGVQRLIISHIAVLDVLEPNMPDLREVFIESQGCLRLLSLPQSDTVDGRIAEAEKVDFKDILRECVNTDTCWSDYWPIKLSLKKLVDTYSHLTFNLKVEAAIAAQGFNLVKVRQRRVLADMN